ncbi:hypothetical protein FHX53_001167 [Yonghaparkia alkaliphila]|uniref:Uncharacterized protein n=1 Tax=Microcella alkalica TaxID=355930 RepID=A0A839EAV5_9MICO|nr:hypothetical protein [Microcella alkalica]
MLGRAIGSGACAPRAGTGSNPGSIGLSTKGSGGVAGDACRAVPHCVQKRSPSRSGEAQFGQAATRVTAFSRAPRVSGAERDRAPAGQGSDRSAHPPAPVRGSNARSSASLDPALDPMHDRGRPTRRPEVPEALPRHWAASLLTPADARRASRAIPRSGGSSIANPDGRGRRMPCVSGTSRGTPGDRVPGGASQGAAMAGRESDGPVGARGRTDRPPSR